MGAFDPQTDTKVCGKCQARKAGTEFYARKNHGNDPYAGHCRACTILIGKEYKARPEIKERRNQLRKERDRRKGIKPKPIVVDLEKGQRRCPKCLEWKEIENNFKNNGYCKPCAIIAARIRRQQPEHKERHRKYNAEMRATEKGRAYVKAYNAKRRLDPEFLLQEKLHNAERRALKSGSIGKYGKDDLDRIFRLQNGKCAICKYDFIERGIKWHADHIYPLALGGTNYPNNIQLLCPTCNQKKHATDPLVYMRRLGYLL